MNRLNSISITDENTFQAEHAWPLKKHTKKMKQFLFL